MSEISSALMGVLTLAALVLALWVAIDYRQWKALGKGGVPYNFQGWLLVTYFRMHKREPIGTAIYADQIGGPADSVHLYALVSRQGPRPRIGVHPVPHRQLDQLADGDARRRLDEIFDQFVAQNVHAVRYVKSFYEKRNEAVTLLDVSQGHPLAQISQGEIAHIHPADGSMHMIFSPSDAKQVIEKGWGERHPLAGSPKFNLPDTYLLIYAPRNEQEVGVVNQLLCAAVQHLCVCQCVSATA